MSCKSVMHDLKPIDFNPFSDSYRIEKICITNESQKEIWLSCKIGGDDANRSYNECISLNLSGEINTDALDNAVCELVRRHEALRCTISPDGESLIIYQDAESRITLSDFSDLPEAEAKARHEDFLKELALSVFDLESGPLFKIFLHKFPAGKSCITILKHHIIGDGWSSGIILEDLAALYTAFRKGEDAVLKPAYQISDYNAALELFRTGSKYNETEQYWLRMYEEEIPVLDLPCSYKRPSPRTYRAERIDQPISKDIVEQLRKFGAGAETSLVTTLLAAFEVFLYKITQQNDIVVGLPAAGQLASDLIDTVGHCVNLLPLRTRIHPDRTFRDYLHKRRAEILDAYDHQQITLGTFIKKLYIPRDPSRIPLVPVMFNIDMGMDRAVKFEGLSHKLTSNPRAFENFEIFLNVTGTEEELVMEWSYNTDLFKASRIRNFHEQYVQLLEEILAGRDTPIAELLNDTMTVDGLIGKKIEISAGLTFNELFRKTVSDYPLKKAVSCNGLSLTYQELDHKIELFSQLFTGRGLTKGDVVAISLNRSVEMLISLLACLRTGLVYLPVDPSYPAERTEFMIQDSAAKLLVTTGKHSKRYSDSIQFLLIDEIPDAAQPPSKGNIASAVSGSDLVYMLYTSGSTGKPKGVKITHGNLINFLLSMSGTPGISEGDKLLAITSMSFDIAGLELYLPLMTGAELHIADSNQVRDGRLLLDTITKEEITIMQATPASWQMMLDAGWETPLPLKMLCGGEALTQSLARKLLSKGAELWNMYGPTETTIWSTVARITDADQPITIGSPIANTSIYILDKSGRALPAGETGEICIGGAGVAAGYHNREELTEEKFIPDTFNLTRGGKLYRTGDLGMIEDNGELICLGRIDQQIKIRGHRIEPSEIETVVLEIPEIKECAVVAREETHGDKRLACYITLEDSNTGDNNTSWKERWDTLYEIGAENQHLLNADDTIDRNLLAHHTDREGISAQAEEWLKASVDRIAAIGARHIYEIGSGAGQVMFELAKNTDSYFATDYAAPAIESINERLLRQPGQWKNIRAAVATADDFSSVNEQPIDLVVINSVAQYFPDADYLLKVISRAAASLKQGGCIFIGDMQGKNSLTMCHAIDHLARSSELATVANFKKTVENRVRIEEELVADPDFFYLLPEHIPSIKGVNVQLRTGQALNETTKYHYDVWIYVDQLVKEIRPETTHSWKGTDDIDKIREMLSSGRIDALELTAVPNSRTMQDHRLMQLLAAAPDENVIAGIKNEVAKTSGGIHPDELRELGAQLHYNVHTRWTTDGTDNLYDVIFFSEKTGRAIPAPPTVADHDIYAHVRVPFRNEEVRIAEEQLEKWRNQLARILPTYMIPDDFVALKQMPLTPNGKVDRKALPKPGSSKPAKEKARSLTHSEKLVASSWMEALGIGEPGPDENFFQLGGHSLLAVKVMVSLEKKTGKRLNITTLFEHPTIEQLARQLESEGTTKEWSSLVAINTAGNKTPLFFVHGADLNVLLFKSLSEYLDADQPVYGLQALGLNYETEIPGSIEEIAAVYVADMLKINPDGPYAIAGYSLGGFLAFEISRLLRNMGKDVSFLGIIDTYAGTFKPQNRLSKIRHEVNKVAFLTKSLVNNTQEALSYQIDVARRKLGNILSTASKYPDEILTRYEGEIYQRYSDALDNYILQPSDVKVTMFAVKKKLYYVEDPDTLGWKHFALKGVDTFRVPGDHKSVLYPPNSRVLAEQLQQVLNKLAQKQP